MKIHNNKNLNSKNESKKVEVIGKNGFHIWLESVPKTMLKSYLKS